ncbi:excisionase Xis [Serratia fonticola]
MNNEETKMNAEEMLTTENILALLKVSTSTLHRLRKRKVNPLPDPDFYGIGETNKWRSSSIAAWQAAEIERAKVKPAQHLHESVKRFSRRAA